MYLGIVELGKIKEKGMKGKAVMEYSLRFYIANSEENIIRGVATAGTINTENTIISRELKKQKEKELKRNWNEKRTVC